MRQGGYLILILCHFSVLNPPVRLSSSLALSPPQVSDIFQFIVANNAQDIGPEDAEVVASSKSRSNSGAVASPPGSLPQSLLLHTALLLVLALSNCQFDRRRLGLG